MAMSGWNDPIWRSLYPTRSPETDALQQHAQQQQAPVAPVHYLDRVQQAAAAGANFNLYNLPGYQTNLSSPAITPLPTTNDIVVSGDA